MRLEALQAPEVTATLLARDDERYATLVGTLVREAPRALLTVARGSSDHAAHYMAYLMMARLGQLVTSLPMSVVTLYAGRLPCEGLVSVAFSQSGQSPDLLQPTQDFTRRGARTVAVVNDTASPLARASRWVLPLHAGAETSVAATKSFIAQLVAGARLVAEWERAQEPAQEQDQEPARDRTQDLGQVPQRPDADPSGPAAASLREALDRLPAALQQATAQDWSAALPVLAPAQRLMVIGRGPGLAVALEAALKFKETCGLQAEAYSGAEVRHGPMALVEAGYPLLVFAPRGPAQAGLLTLAEDLRARGARVLVAAPAGTGGAELPLVPTAHPDLDPIAAVQSFYLCVEALARARGRDPDAPPHLAKVTRTR